MLNLFGVSITYVKIGSIKNKFYFSKELKNDCLITYTYQKWISAKVMHGGCYNWKALYKTPACS
jgi:hypothetical protein